MGPYYSSATPFQTNTKNQKFVINGIAGIAAGVYFGDVWITSGEVQLPSEALFGTVKIPSPCGYKDWSTRETGLVDVYKRQSSHRYVYDLLIYYLRLKKSTVYLKSMISAVGYCCLLKTKTESDSFKPV